MFKHGLVFKHENKLWLSLYNKNGDLQEGSVISDDEGIYDDLALDTIAVVAVEVGDVLNLSDLLSVQLKHETAENGLFELIKSGDFPAFAKEIWEKEL